MPIDPADLPELAALLAPMATAENVTALLANTQHAALPPIVGLHGDIAKTQAWLASLDDAQARSLFGKLSAVPVVAAAIAKLSSSTLPASRPQGPWPFVLDIFPAVNRSTFWQHLKQMLGPRKRILVIRGDRGVGKTYTGERILRELPRRNNAVPISVVYQRVDGANSVENVVQNTLSKLMLPASNLPSLDAQQSTSVAAKKEWWIKEMVEQLLLRIHADRSRQVWLALDGHAKDGQHPELTMFFTELVAQVAQWAPEPNGCRLLLIDHPEVVAQGVTQLLLLREDVALATEADVILFLDEVLGAKPENVAQAAAIWARVQAVRERDRMITLCDELAPLNPQAGGTP